MNYPVLAQRVRYFKEDTKKVQKTMLADGLPYETIARYAKLPIEEVKALDTKKPA